MQIATIANDEIEEFDRIDGNGDRSITFEEFSRLMLEMDHAKPATELRACFNTIDLDRDGRVDLEDFRRWISR